MSSCHPAEPDGVSGTGTLLCGRQYSSIRKKSTQILGALFLDTGPGEKH